MIQLIIIIIIIVVLVLTTKNKKIKEGFYYYPPSNCSEDVFGKTTCYPLYPPYLYPHYEPIRPSYRQYYVPRNPYYWRRQPYIRPLFRLF